MYHVTRWVSVRRRAGCSQQMDVVFVLDISGSVQEKYDNAVWLARNVTYGLDVDSGNVRVGAVAYSSTPLGEFHLRDYVNRRENVVHSLRFHNPGGSTNTADALDRVRSTHLTVTFGARTGVRKVSCAAPPPAGRRTLRSVKTSSILHIDQLYLP